MVTIVSMEQQWPQQLPVHQIWTLDTPSSRRERWKAQFVVAKLMSQCHLVTNWDHSHNTQSWEDSDLKEESLTVSFQKSTKPQTLANKCAGKWDAEWWMDRENGRPPRYLKEIVNQIKTCGHPTKTGQVTIMTSLLRVIAHAFRLTRIINATQLLAVSITRTKYGLDVAIFTNHMKTEWDFAKMELVNADSFQILELVLVAWLKANKFFKDAAHGNLTDAFH